MSRSQPQQQKQPEPIRSKDYVFTFGKYKGFTLGDVMYSHPQYVLWLHNNNDFFELHADLLDELESTSWRDPA